MSRPEVIDIFSGCGGLALGFQKAGFKITHGIELMPEAVKTVSYNIDWRFGEETSHICGDITQMDTSIFKERIGKDGCIVIGGPPCQAYSLAGKGKLRSLGQHRIHTNDKRGYLFQDFLRFAIELDARAVIMENVPEAVNFGEINVPQLVCEELEKYDYNAIWTILNAADYGVPQIRERVFVIAIKKNENVRYELPKATYASILSDRVSNEIRFRRFNNCKNFRVPNINKNGASQWVTVGDALGDLPRLFATANSKYKLNSLNIEMKYHTDIQNGYQKIMREWYGNGNKTVTGNAFRNNARDFKIFERMKQGDNYADAARIADEIFNENIKAMGINEQDNYETFMRLKKEIIPPYNREKFIGKWRKLNMNAPSHTLVAHLSKDTYSHIHPFEPRGISVREAARLQSFPDDFFFNCSMGEAFKQIGNAVPPLLAKGIADSIISCFEEG
ncbi:DNA cytosine methyltransferase [Cellulosilyticum lentocellum]|uniref:DNA (cytosine-5-)-methyltransferase n=1 Tax=Cellulosilyticum lentocellum (strain ATCC 49066 / DSM 5427 / NCIMB 11756 / RHM5) TaxID=642492 RepID=F2JIR1_CELLD|nr:DNA cytosine methyltransferase [Cellulosilyticum lentocellum]ADZ81983.1 DNA-cytosine methyltransferase [Cellulosilyticum lentocellum DSM 5427]